MRRTARTSTVPSAGRAARRRSARCPARSPRAMPRAPPSPPPPRAPPLPVRSGRGRSSAGRAIRSSAASAAELAQAPRLPDTPDAHAGRGVAASHPRDLFVGGHAPEAKHAVAQRAQQRDQVAAFAVAGDLATGSTARRRARETPAEPVLPARSHRPTPISRARSGARWASRGERTPTRQPQGHTPGAAPQTAALLGRGADREPIRPELWRPVTHVAHDLKDRATADLSAFVSRHRHRRVHARRRPDLGAHSRERDFVATGAQTRPQQIERVDRRRVP